MFFGPEGPFIIDHKMYTVEPVSLKELIVTDYRALMSFRVRKILMICSNYDAFILEEDGQIESQIYKEYIELNLSNPPQFLWVTSSSEAEKIMAEDNNVDMVMCMYNDKDRDIFDFAKKLKNGTLSADKNIDGASHTLLEGNTPPSRKTGHLLRRLYFQLERKCRTDSSDRKAVRRPDKR